MSLDQENRDRYAERAEMWEARALEAGDVIEGLLPAPAEVREPPNSEDMRNKALQNERAKSVFAEFPAAFEAWLAKVVSVRDLKTAQNQRYHIPGTKEYDPEKGKSWFDLGEDLGKEESVEAVREIINEAAGSGYPGVNKNGEWDGYEYDAKCGKIIGVDRWSMTQSSTVNIYYGKDKVHATPTFDGGEPANEDQKRRAGIRRPGGRDDG